MAQLLPHKLLTTQLNLKKNWSKYCVYCSILCLNCTHTFNLDKTSIVSLVFLILLLKYSWKIALMKKSAAGFCVHYRADQSVNWLIRKIILHVKMKWDFASLRISMQMSLHIWWFLYGTIHPQLLKRLPVLFSLFCSWNKLRNYNL